MTKQITVGKVKIGGGVPVSIQSMLNTKTTDVEGSLCQIRELAAAGCEIARLAVPDMESAEAFRKICDVSPLPLVADIHFDYRPSRQRKTALPKSASTPETSGARNGSRPSPTAARRTIFRSASA